MKRIILMIVMLAVPVVFGEGGVCPPQRWGDPNNWPFVPDPNRVPGHYAKGFLWEIGVVKGFSVTVCDPEGRQLEVEWLDIPIGTTIEPSMPNQIWWQPSQAGIEAYFTMRITDDPNGQMLKQTTFTWGALTIPENQMPVIDIEPKLVPFGL